MNEQLEGIFDHDRQLNELSKKTYGNYIKKSAADIDNEKTDTNPKNEEEEEVEWRKRWKVRKRLKGIGRATDALVGGKKKANKSMREDVEGLEESGFQSSSDAHRAVQDSMRADAKRQQNRTLDLLVKVHRGEISKRKFNKVHGGGFTFDELMKSRFYANKIKRMPKSKLAPAKKPVMEAGEAELGRARKAEAQARKGAVKRSGTTVDGKVVKAGERGKKLMLMKLTKERTKAGLDPRIPRSRAKTDNKGEKSTTTGYKRDVPKSVMDYRAASQAKKRAALRSKGVA
jgi:hypothetical protein